MRISIASGKGGTGKTTVATNLALSIGLNVQLLDCDVEEPNAHLFIHPVFEETDTVFTPVPDVNEKKCTYCGKCAEICQFKAIAVLEKAFWFLANFVIVVADVWRSVPKGPLRKKKPSYHLPMNQEYYPLGFIN